MESDHSEGSLTLKKGKGRKVLEALGSFAFVASASSEATSKRTNTEGVAALSIDVSF